MNKTQDIIHTQQTLKIWLSVWLKRHSDDKILISYLEYMIQLTENASIKWITSGDAETQYTIFRQFLIDEPEIVVEKGVLNCGEFGCLFEQIKNLRANELEESITTKKIFKVGKKNILITSISEKEIGLDFGIIYGIYEFMKHAKIATPEKVKYLVLGVKILD